MARYTFGSFVPAMLRSTVLLGLMTTTACKDLTKDPGLPAGTPDPVTYQTADGAIGMRVAAILQLNGAIPNYLVSAGLLSDELDDRLTGITTGLYGITDPLDERILPEGGDAIAAQTNGVLAYYNLQSARGAANLALAALAAYDTVPANLASQRVYRGELYALQAYTEILLAGLYCSGVPLSTIDFKQDFTYKPGSTTSEVYTDARTKLDSALSLATGSDSIVNLARVLKGRVYLELGNYTAAADDVALVPTTFQYRLTIDLRPMANGIETNLTQTRQVWSIADREGTNGLPFLSEIDGRVDTVAMCRAQSCFNSINNNGTPLPVQTITTPRKYFGNATASFYTPFVVANGIEARLIEAEASLRAAPSSTQWLTILNTLRTNGTGAPIAADTIADTLGITGCGPDAAHWCAADGVSNGYFVVPTGYTLTPALGFTIQPVGSALSSACVANSYYTPCYNASGSAEVRVYTRPAGVAWNAGTGGVNGLGPLADSGATVSTASAPGARVAELFRERAYWMFMTGHRQSDLRRLLRQYGSQSQYPQFRSQDKVYPSGLYDAPGTGIYGTAVTAPIPSTENANPYFHGCKDRNA